MAGLSLRSVCPPRTWPVSASPAHFSSVKGTGRPRLAPLMAACSAVSTRGVLSSSVLFHYRANRVPLIVFLALLPRRGFQVSGRGHF